MIHVDVEGNWDNILLTGEMTWTVAVTPPLHPHHWPGRIRIIMRYRPGVLRQGWIKTWTMINVLLIIVARHWCVYESHNYWLPNIASVHSYCRKCISISLCCIEDILNKCCWNFNHPTSCSNIFCVSPPEFSKLQAVRTLLRKVQCT